MEFFIAREPFLKLLGRVQSVADKRTTMPILANLLLNVEQERLTVSATDLEVSVRAFCDAPLVHVEKPGTLAVSARKLHDIVRELPDKEIHLRADKNQRLHIQCEEARFFLSTLAPEEFPELPAPGGDHRLQLSTATLAEMLNRTHYAMSQDETRFTLNGLFLQIDPGSQEGEQPVMRMVATDTHRLALVESPVSEDQARAAGVIIPRKGVMEIKRLLEEEEATVDVVLGEGHVQFGKPGVILVSKLVDGRFPKYEKVIPTDNSHRAVMDRMALMGTVRRMAVISHEKSHGIQLKFAHNLLHIDTNNPEQELADEKMVIDYAGPEMAIGFNARYLIDLLGAIQGDSLHFMLADEEKPVLATDPERDHFLCVLMPMRI